MWTLHASILHASATSTLEYVTPGARIVRLDTNHLTIRHVTSGSGDDQAAHALPYTLHPVNKSKAHLGQQLSINLPTQRKLKKVTVQYKTITESSAVQWLPAQTTGGEHP